MYRKIGPAVYLCLAIGFLSGCGTIKHGTTQKLVINSSPPGAYVIVDGRDQGQTPISVDLSRKTRHTISVSMFGYRTYQTMLKKKLSGWAVLGGPVGLLIDDATGGMYKLSPDRINVQLAPDSLQFMDR